MRFLKIFLLLCVTLISCQQEKKQKKNQQLQKLKYAKGFSIENFNGYKKLTINSPYKNADKTFEYLLVPKETAIPKGFSTTQIIRTPVEKIVVTSTSHIPLLELLHKETTLVGFPNTDFISSENTRKLIDQGKVQELGQEAQINTEILLDLEPELVMSFAVDKPNKSFNTIQKLGVPILLNGDWLEETPLGRAEWLQLFGVIFHEEKRADSIFNHIEKEYLKAKEIAKTATTKPTILSGSIFQDVWYVPAGESFIATYLKDAQTNYLWDETEGTGSLALNFENVLEKAQNADFWIGCSLYENQAQLLKGNIHYNQFSAFKKKTIYTFANNKGTTGGIFYFEVGPIRPDIILKDMIKITHPELLPNYKLFFFEQLK